MSGFWQARPRFSLSLASWQNRTVETDVAIVGGGPVGLSLAVDLGARGVSCVVLERRERGSATFPTANHIGIRTMEHLRRLGLAREVGAAFSRADHGHWVALTHIGGREIARVDHALAGPPPSYSPEHEVWAPKPCFDPILERAASKHATVELRRATRVVGIENVQEGVLCRTLDAAGAPGSEVRARFAVACDGAASRVRESLGIEMRGPPPLPIEIHSAFFRSARVREGVPSGVVQVAILGTSAAPTPTPFGAGLLIAVDDRDLWRLHGIGLDARDEDVTRSRLAELGADDAEIFAMSAWTPRQAIAESFRRENVFLAGDAAHLVTPFGGLGVNTGMADAFDLAWKIEATLRGWGGPALLDSYDVERRAAAMDLLRYQNVDESGDELVRLGPPLPLHDPPTDDLWRTDSVGEQARRDYGAGLVSSRGDEFDKPTVDLGYRYDGSPVIVDDGSPTPDRSDARRYIATNRPGGRAPHVDLDDGRSTLDLFGKGLVVLQTAATPGDSDSAAFEKAASERGIPLRTEVVPEAASAFETSLTLVRPDGFVAWRGNEPPSDVGAVLDVVVGR